MSCPSISECCSSCLKTCCPKLAAKKRTRKYAYVKYIEGKEKSSPAEKPTHKRTVSLPVAMQVPPEKLFTFPQEKARGRPIVHPQMFTESVITSQPSAHQEFRKRFDSQTSNTSTGGEYTRCVTGSAAGGSGFASGQVSGGESAVDSSSDELVVPERRPRSATMPANSSYHRSRISKDDLSSPAESKSHRKKLMRKRSVDIPIQHQPTDIQEIQERYAEWVPGLPILQENTLEREENHPTLQFSLHYDIHRCVLTVHLHHASNLPAKDRRGTSDPFVVLYLTPNKVEIYQSKIVYRSLNPVYNQSFDFHGLTSDDIRRQTLIFRVYDHDKFSKNDTIGCVSLPLDGADLFGVVMRMSVDEGLKLNDEIHSQGDLLLALSHNPQMNLLKGLVLKATNLKKQDIVGLADPYVKIYLIHKHARVEKWKSSVKPKTLVPVFNETFQFDLKNRDLEDIVLEVFIMDYDRFSRNDAMGVVLLGKDVKQESGRKHWNDMIVSPQSVSMWHSILPASEAVKPNTHHLRLSKINTT